MACETLSKAYIIVELGLCGSGRAEEGQATDSDSEQVLHLAEMSI